MRNSPEIAHGLANIARELDVRGYNCPIPLMRAKKALATMQPGQVLKIITTDPGAEIDFKVYCEASGNPILSLDESSNTFTIVIAKRQA
ncbi:MAG: SirA-like protein [Betaproteobacteria bacterium]|nr:SirA-like protein [Betaproteobacteria bacterium]